MESQNIQLLLNLQLQAKTLSKYDKYFSNLEHFPLVNDDDLLEEEEDEETYSENYEEDKYETSNETKSSKTKM